MSNEVEFCLISDILSNIPKPCQPALLFARSWSENSWIHTFPKRGVKCKRPRPIFEPGALQQLLITVTIILRAPPTIIEFPKLCNYSRISNAIPCTKIIKFLEACHVRRLSNF